METAEIVIYGVLLLFVWLGLVGHLILVWRDVRIIQRHADESQKFFERAITRLEVNQIACAKHWQSQGVWTGE